MKNSLKLFFVALLCLPVAACSSRNVKEETVRTVKTDTVQTWGETAASVFPGKVRASSDINLAFKVSGTIERVNADEGAFVRKGQTLVVMDPRDYTLQLAATEAEYARIKGEAERVIALYEKGSVSENDYEKALYGLQQITAKHDSHKNALEDTRLVAPFDGYVQKTYFKKGEAVAAGMPVVSLISRDMPEVEINIPAADFIKRENFDRFTATVDIYPGVEFPLQLVGVNQKANMNQLYQARFRIPGAQQGVLPAPGMSAMVTIYYKPGKSESVSLPIGALFESDAKPAVWIYDAATNSVSMRNVKLEQILTDGRIVVSGGIKAGDVVVTAGANSLEEGQKVRPIEPVSSTNVGNLL